MSSHPRNSGAAFLSGLAAFLAAGFLPSIAMIISFWPGAALRRFGFLAGGALGFVTWFITT